MKNESVGKIFSFDSVDALGNMISKDAIITYQGKELSLEHNGIEIEDNDGIITHGYFPI